MMAKEDADVGRDIEHAEHRSCGPDMLDSRLHLEYSRHADQISHVDHVMLGVFRVGSTGRHVDGCKVRRNRQYLDFIEDNAGPEVRLEVDADLALALLDERLDRTLTALDVATWLEPLAELGMLDEQNTALLLVRHEED